MVAFVLATLFSMVFAELAETYPMSEVLDWEIDSQMQLSITSDGDLVPILFTVIPLTADLGLNESQTDRGVNLTPTSSKCPCPTDPAADLRLTRESIYRGNSPWPMRPHTRVLAETMSSRTCAATR